MAEVEVVKDSNLELFARWILDKTETGKCVNEQQCANYLTTLVKGRIFEKDIKTWVSRARKYAYSHLNQFIIKEKDKGWRVAIGSDERENTCAKIIRLTSKHMNNGFLAYGALKKHEIINLARKLRHFREMTKNLKQSEHIRISFEDSFIKFTERIAERLEANEQKQIEGK